MTYTVDAWLKASSQNDEIRLMLIDNEIRTHVSFECLDKEEIYSLEQVKNNGANTKLRSHHAKILNDTREYISFLEENGDSAIATDPTKWVKRDFERWHSSTNNGNNNSSRETIED